MSKTNKILFTIISVILFILALMIVIFAGLKKRAENEALTTEIPVSTTIEIATTEAGTTEMPSTEPAVTEITISFIGDCMFASNLESTAQGSFNAYASEKSADYFLGGVSEILLSDDYTIANCECVLSDNNLTPKARESEVQFWFKGKASYAEIFKVSGVDFAGTTNNHSYDYGVDGYNDTVEALSNAGITAGVRDEYNIVDIKGVKTGIYACSLYSYDYVYDILDKLNSMKNEGCDLKIIFFHGGIEGVDTPEDWKINACHTLAENGADIIVGAHPHRLQFAEDYNGCSIVYSLGNFCFGGNNYPHNRTAIYQATYTLVDGKPTDRTDTIIPCYVYTGSENNYRPEIITDEETKQEVLDFMNTPTY